MGCRCLLTTLGAFWACWRLQMPLQMLFVTTLVLTSPLFSSGAAASLLFLIISLISLIHMQGNAEAFVKECNNLCTLETELHGVSYYCIPFPSHSACCGLCWEISPTPQAKYGLGRITQHLHPPKHWQHQPLSLSEWRGAGRAVSRDSGILLPCFDTSWEFCTQEAVK